MRTAVKRRGADGWLDSEAFNQRVVRYGVAHHID